MSDTFFSMFTPSEIAKISSAGTKITMPEGWSPISERTGADKAYVILSGEVSVRHDGKEIARLGEGDIIGEAAIIGRTLRTASIVSLSKLELIHFTADALRRLDVDMPKFHTALEKVAEERMSGDPDDAKG